MKRNVATVVMILCLALDAAAQGKKHDKNGGITIKIGNLSCTTSAGSNTFEVSSYSFGASQQTSSGSASGGAGAGKATIAPLKATKKFDACSPRLFGGVVTGEHFATADLVQHDGDGDITLTISLTDAVITSYVIGGDDSSDTPQESISIEFRKICISEPSSNNKLCFDASTNTTS